MHCNAVAAIMLSTLCGVLGPTGAAADDAPRSGDSFALDARACRSSDGKPSQRPRLIDEIVCQPALDLDHLDLQLSFRRLDGVPVPADFDTYDPSSAALLRAPIESAPPRLGETASELHLDGRSDRLSYQVDVGSGREARFDSGTLRAESGTDALLQGKWDLGLVRSRIEIAGYRASADPLPLVALAPEADDDSTGSGRFFLDLAIPDLPTLTLAIGRQRRESAWGSDGQSEHKAFSSDVASATLWLERPKWQAFAISSVYSIADEVKGGPDGILYDEYLAGSLWPASTVTINPDLHYMKGSYDGGATWLATSEGSLGVYSSGLWSPGDVGIYSGYSSSRDSAGAVDYARLDFALAVQKTVEQIRILPGYRARFDLKLGYSYYTDRVRPSTSSAGLSSFATVTIFASDPDSLLRGLQRSPHPSWR